MFIAGKPLIDAQRVCSFEEYFCPMDILGVWVLLARELWADAKGVGAKLIGL